MRHIISDFLNSFCRTDLKFCSCSDDTTVKVWDFARCQEERSLSGNVLWIHNRMCLVDFYCKNILPIPECAVLSDSSPTEEMQWQMACLCLLHLNKGDSYMFLWCFIFKFLNIVPCVNLRYIRQINRAWWSLVMWLENLFYLFKVFFSWTVINLLTLACKIASCSSFWQSSESPLLILLELYLLYVHE